MSCAYILFGRHYLSSHIIKYEPSLLHFCSVHHKQMLRSTVRWHSSHITLQHHKNLQLHLSITVSMVVRQPRPQHMRSQPSTPLLFSLHSLPCVPSEPRVVFLVQKSGDSLRQTRSLSEYGVYLLQNIIKGIKFFSSDPLFMV